MEPNENGQGQQGSSPGRRFANTAVNVGRTIARKAVQEGIKRIGQFAASSTGVGLLLAGGIEALDAASNPEAYVKKIIYIVTAIVLFLIILIVLIVLVISEGGSGTGAGGSNTASGSAQPVASSSALTTDDCNGKYKSAIARNWMLHSNFGDPQCDYTPEKVKALLEQSDQANANWWQIVIQCESGKNPLAWNDPNHKDNNGKQTPDAGGAWGLYQDGSSAILQPESLYCGRVNPCRRDVTLQDVSQPAGGGSWGHGGVSDRGDIDWRTQTQYAIGLLSRRGKGYWACAPK